MTDLSPPNLFPDPAGRLTARSAAARRVTMERRARRIRKSIVAVALGLFAAAFITVYTKLASGNDPAVEASAARRASATQLTASVTVSNAAAERAGEDAAARKAAAARQAVARRRAAAKRAAARRRKAEHAAAAGWFAPFRYLLIVTNSTVAPKFPSSRLIGRARRNL